MLGEGINQLKIIQSFMAYFHSMCQQQFGMRELMMLSKPQQQIAQALMVG